MFHRSPNRPILKNSLLAIIFSLALAPLGRAADAPPNVVLIFADDLGYGDLGCYGATKVQTPNIDRLAAEGRRFTDAHSVSAVCTPSRYALLTGQYPVRGNGGKGVWGPAPVTSPLIVDTDRTTIADVFKNRGYDTAAFGKWHLGFGKEKNDWQEPLRPGPQDLGFDHYFGMPVVNSAPPYVFVQNDRVVGSDPDDPLVFLGRNAKGVTPITKIPPEAAQRTANQFAGAKKAHSLFNDYQVGTTLAKKSVTWINEHKDNPFFLYLATTNIHHPFTPAKRFQGTSQCGLYGDFIHELDWIVGEVLSCLEENGLSDNTLVIFTSDNGGMFNRGGQAAFKAGHRQNSDLLGFKFGAWEGGHRVPMIARWPGMVKAGTTSDQLIGNVDMLATFSALTGQKLNQTADSVDMLPALVGEPEHQIRDHLVLAPHKGTHLSIRKGKWMYIPARGSGGFVGRKPGDHTFAGPAAASFVGSINSDIKDGKIKKDAPPAQLYDLHADVNQTRNLYEEHPQVVGELSSLLDEYAPTARQPAQRRSPDSRNPAKKVPATPSTRTASFDFETGELQPWKVIEGEFGHLVGSRERFFHHQGEYNKQGTYYLTTLESSANAAKGTDGQTGVVVSPLFIPEAGMMTFRIGGGRGKATYAALCSADGKEVEHARGINHQAMQLAKWDLTPYAGQKVFIKVVDHSTTGWGHITIDNVQFDGKVLNEYPKPTQPAAQAAARDDLASLAKRQANQANRALPNFVVIFADDLGYGDISCYSADGVQTPHLDALANGGFRSTDMFVPANVCSPSRAALLTGRYPMRCGMPVARTEKPGSKYGDYGLAAGELTIPELLRPAGYRSLMVGKWHLGLELEGSHPLDAGFDEHLGIPSNYEPKRGPHYDTLYRGRQVEQKNIRCQELTRRYTDEVVDFIGRQKDDPFFIYVSHHIVHSPLLPSKDFVGTSDKGKYGDFIKELDHSTGRIMKAIRDAGLDDNTLVVFTSDNGPTRAGSTGGLAGGKYGTMEGGHRVPGIFRWPGKIPAGQVSSTTISSMDLLPLFCGLTGVDPPTNRKIDGKNILAILQGKVTDTPHQRLYYYNGTNLQAVREGNWKLHLPRTPKDQPFWSKNPLHTFKGFVKLDERQLFALNNDLGEKTNVADRYPEIVDRLQQHAESIRAELGDVRTLGTDQRKINLVDPQER